MTEPPSLRQRFGAEFVGTFALVFAGAGAIVIDEKQHGAVSHAGIAATFGLVIMVMIYAVGHISGGHFNPAVTVGLWAGGRCSSADVVPYVIAQVVGAIAAAAALYWIASGKPGWSRQASPRTDTAI